MEFSLRATGGDWMTLLPHEVPIAISNQVLKRTLAMANLKHQRFT
jgi:hypothetical protein